MKRYNNQRGLGRKTREEIGTRNQITSLRFQTVGTHKTPRFLFGLTETDRQITSVDLSLS